ncbi:hypothetical protein YC2023_055003 [Brassica napus]
MPWGVNKIWYGGLFCGAGSGCGGGGVIDVVGASAMYLFNIVPGSCDMYGFADQVFCSGLADGIFSHDYRPAPVQKNNGWGSSNKHVGWLSTTRALNYT